MTRLLSVCRMTVLVPHNRSTLLLMWKCLSCVCVCVFTMKSRNVTTSLRLRLRLASSLVSEFFRNSFHWLYDIVFIKVARALLLDCFQSIFTNRQSIYLAEKVQAYETKSLENGRLDLTVEEECGQNKNRDRFSIYKVRLNMESVSTIVDEKVLMHTLLWLFSTRQMPLQRNSW